MRHDHGASGSRITGACACIVLVQPAGNIRGDAAVERIIVTLQDVEEPVGLGAGHGKGDA